MARSGSYGYLTGMLGQDLRFIHTYNETGFDHYSVFRAQGQCVSDQLPLRLGWLATEAEDQQLCRVLGRTQDNLFQRHVRLLSKH